MSRTLVADLESNGLLHELDRIWVLCIKDAEGGPVAAYSDHFGDFNSSTRRPLHEGLERLKRAEKVVIHNCLGFDIHALHQTHPGYLRFEQVVDTLVWSRLVDPEGRRHSLEKLGEALGRPKVKHDEWDRFSEEMVVRCSEDVEITHLVWKDLAPKVEGFDKALALEHKVALVMSLQEQQGFALDLERVHALRVEFTQELDDIAKKLQLQYPPRFFPSRPQLTKEQRSRWRVVGRRVWPLAGFPFRNKTGKLSRKNYTDEAPFIPVKLMSFNPGSTQDVARRLMWHHGWKPTVKTETGLPKLDADVLSDIAIQYPMAADIARYTLIGTKLGQIEGWLKAVRKDKDGVDRVHGGVNPQGARTYRMSHFSPNMANVDKKEKRMRACWVASPGNVLVGVDAEGLEERNLAGWCKLFGDTEGAYIKAVVSGDKKIGTDPHSLAQKALGFASRDTTKTFKYALFYGAGGHKLGLIYLEDRRDAGLPTPEGDLEQIGRGLKKKFGANIVGFKALQAACKKRTDERGYIVGPAGHHVRSPYAHAALNTLLQHEGAIVMKQTLAAFHFTEAVEALLVSRDFLTTYGFSYVANVHDEVQLEASPSSAGRIGEMLAACITKAGETLGQLCPQKGEVKIGPDWSVTH